MTIKELQDKILDSIDPRKSYSAFDIADIVKVDVVVVLEAINNLVDNGKIEVNHYRKYQLPKPDSIKLVLRMTEQEMARLSHMCFVVAEEARNGRTLEPWFNEGWWEDLGYYIRDVLNERRSN